MNNKETFNAKKETVKHDWFVVDAAGKTVGTLATKVARVLTGKHKPIFTPHVDTGDFVVIINAEQIVLSGDKWDTKMYRWRTTRPGSMKEVTAKKMLEKKPTMIVEQAVKGMLPKTKLGRKMAKKLKVYAGGEHPHTAQKPQTLVV